MARPTVLTKCVADTYTDKASERIIEFGDGLNGPGGLISFTRTDDGRLVVDLYQLDEGIEVRVSGERLPRS